jgi:hypothetical protein
MKIINPWRSSWRLSIFPEDGKASYVGGLAELVLWKWLQYQKQSTQQQMKEQRKYDTHLHTHIYAYIHMYIYIDIYISWLIYIYQPWKEAFISTIMENEIMSFAERWIELEIIMLSVISQARKAKYHMFSLICWTWI